jgi:hypothetical protein
LEGGFRESLSSHALARRANEGRAAMSKRRTKSVEERIENLVRKTP